MMDQILLRRSDEHTPTVEAERIPSHLFDACAEASDIVPPPAFSRLRRTTKRSRTTTGGECTRELPTLTELEPGGHEGGTCPRPSPPQLRSFSRLRTVLIHQKRFFDGDLGG